MAISLASISKGARLRAPRIVLLGREKIGKTSFACGARYEGGRLVESGLNNPIVIPIKGEEGTDALDVPIFPTCATFADVMDAVAALYDEEHEFRMLVIDSASALAPLIYDDVCQEFGVDNVRKVPGFRTGEAAVALRWRQLLDGLDALRNSKGMGTIIIGHVRVRKATNQDADQFDAFDFDLEIDIAETLKRWADAIYFASMKISVRKEGKDTDFSRAKRKGVDPSGGQRYLFTQPRPAHPSGGRGVYGQLPAELPLSWTAFEAAVAETARGGE